MSHFKIALPRHAGHGSGSPYWLADASEVQQAKVEIDGVDVTNSVRSISIHASATDVTVVDIEFIASSVEVEADAITYNVKTSS